MNQVLKDIVKHCGTVYSWRELSSSWVLLLKAMFVGFLRTIL